MIAARLGQLADLVNGNPALVRLGRRMTAEFVIGVDEDSWHIAVKEGLLAPPLRGPFRMRSWCFAIRAPAPVWTEFWKRHPRPGYQDIFAMTRFGHAGLEGDLRPLLANLRYVKEVLAAPRAGTRGAE